MPGDSCYVPPGQTVPPPPGVAAIDPPAVTVQVGATVSFTVEASGVGRPSYQWRRSSDGGLSYVDIAGATGKTYSLAGVNLGDDAAVFLVEVRPGNGTSVVQALSRLAVSSMPGVVLQDGEFLPADWSVAPTVDLAQAVPVHSEERATAGGNPGAFRRMVHQMAQGPSALRVFHTSRTATYDPASKGAIHVIDYAEDCIALSNTTPGFLMDSTLLIEQSGRRFITAATDYGVLPSWSAAPRRASLGVQDFMLFDGPACLPGESCPDFSASAAPLRFGFVRHSTLSFGPPGSVEHGIDNWKVTVWGR